MLHTLPIAIYAWWFHRGDLATVTSACVMLGGDTDSVAALAGAFCGAGCGVRPILPLMTRFADPVYRLDVMIATARQAAGYPGERGERLRWWAMPLRNALLAAVVSAHVMRRMLPPYRP